MTVRPARGATARWHVLHAPDIHPYWLDALARSGVPTRRLTDVDPDDAAASIVLLVGDELAASAAVRARAAELHRCGVPVVAGARAAAELTGAGTHRQHVVGLEGTGALFAECPTVRLEAVVDAPAAADRGTLWPHATPGVQLDSDGDRWLLALPLPDADAVLHASPRMVRFGLSAGRGAHEIVSACDHGALRRLLCNALRLACRHRGLPFVRLGPAPGDATGAFAFRVDADDYRDVSTRAVFDAMRAESVRATWFIDVERHALKDGGDWVRRLLEAGHEVQSHAFHHYTYTSAARNRRNLDRARRQLRDWGAAVDAAAAPFGTWNRGLHRAYAQLGVRYSSEFARLYDDVPGVLPPPTGEPPLWQVPIHPVCPALLLDAGLNAAEVSSYFAERVDDGLRRGEPVALYGHPIRDLERCPDLFAHLGAALSRLESDHRGLVWRATLAELRGFYEQRAAQRPRCDVGAERIEVESRGPAPVWLELDGGGHERVVDRASLGRDAEPRRNGHHAGAGSSAPSIPQPWSPEVRDQLARKHRRLCLARMWREARHGAAKVWPA